MQLKNDSFSVLYPAIESLQDEVKQMNVCFLLTHVPNPRMNKRIEVFKQIATTTVICTRRASQNIWEPSQDVDHIIFDIDLPSSKHILKRYSVSQDFQKKALSSLETIQPSIIYAEGLDTLIIAGKYKENHECRVFYEVADLREAFIVKPKKITDKIVTGLIANREKRAFKNVDYLVVTSPKFYEAHYNELIEKKKVLFIPNAPDEKVFAKYKKKSDGDFTVGFIGGIRYLDQMKMLVDASVSVGCKVLFAGAGGTSNEYNEILEYCKEKDNVVFTGRYNYEEEIAELYSRVDCVYSVYDADNPNVRIALPNKLYESIYCDLPIIVAKGTYLSELVESMGVGIAVNHKSKDELVSVLQKLKNDKSFYDNFVANCMKQRKDDSSDVLLGKV